MRFHLIMGLYSDERLVVEFNFEVLKICCGTNREICGVVIHDGVNFTGSLIVRPI